MDLALRKYQVYVPRKVRYMQKLEDLKSAKSLALMNHFGMEIADIAPSFSEMAQKLMEKELADLIESPIGNAQETYKMCIEGFVSTLVVLYEKAITPNALGLNFEAPKGDYSSSLDSRIKSGRTGTFRLQKNTRFVQMACTHYENILNLLVKHAEISKYIEKTAHKSLLTHQKSHQK